MLLPLSLYWSTSLTLRGSFYSPILSKTQATFISVSLKVEIRDREERDAIRIEERTEDRIQFLGVRRWTF